MVDVMVAKEEPQEKVDAALASVEAKLRALDNARQQAAQGAGAEGHLAILQWDL